MKGCVIPRARNHATSQNDISDKSYMKLQRRNEADRGCLMIICFLFDQLVSGEAKPARERWFGAFRELITLNPFQREYTEDDQILVAIRHTENPFFMDLAAENAAPDAEDNSALDLGNVSMDRLN